MRLTRFMRIKALFLIVAVALAGLTWTAAPVAADPEKGLPKIKVKKPNGGEILFHDQKAKIRWKSVGFTGFSVRIELLRDNVFDELITDITPNDGKFNWVIPEDIDPDDGYRIQVISIADPTIKDRSNDPFAIIGI